MRRLAFSLATITLNLGASCVASGSEWRLKWILADARLRLNVALNRDSTLVVVVL